MTTYDSTTVYDAASLTYDGNTPGLANLPVVGVFIAFDDGPYVADPNWVEVTNYVREVSIRRGRQDDLQQFPAGQASVVLDNRDRLFDPFNTAGAYYNKLKPRRQIKIVGQWAGVNYPLFRGFVAGWPVEYSEGGKDSTVTIDCFDALGLLATEVLDSNRLKEYVLSLQPTHYFTMEDFTLFTTYGSPTRNVYITQDFGVDATAYDLQITGTTTRPPRGYGSFQEVPSGASPGLASRSESIIPSQQSRSVLMKSTYFEYEPLESLTGPTSVSFTLMAWLKIVSNSGARFLVSYGALSGVSFYMRIGGGAEAGLVFAIAGNDTSRSNVRIDDGEPHFVVCSRASSGTITIYVDGVDCTTVTGTGVVVGIGRTNAHVRLPLGLVTDAQIFQQVATFWDRALTASEVKEMYNYGLSSKQETIKARVETYLQDIELPSAFYSVSSDLDALVDELPPQNIAALPEIQKVIASGAGFVFVDASGVLVAYENNHVFSATRSNTSQVSFTDTGTGVYYDAGSVTARFDAEQLRNQWVVSGSFGQVASALSASSVGELGIAGENLDTRLATTADAQALADAQLSFYSEPKIRVEPFLVKGQRNPSYDWPRILALDLLDRFTFVRTPSVGSAISKPMLLQSIEHRFTPGTWETIINGSARYTGWFVLDSSLLNGEDVLL